jgi:hypothetical protein
VSNAVRWPPQEKLETQSAGGEAGGDDLDDDFAAGSSGDEGESGDDGGSGSEGESDEEGAGPLQRRQRERAAGDHELQARLRWGCCAIPLDTQQCCSYWNNMAR